jgi:DNA-binding IclR family transcriptional regulator
MPLQPDFPLAATEASLRPAITIQLSFYSMAGKIVTAVTDRPAASTERRGRRPPSGEAVLVRAFHVLAAFDQSHRRLTLASLSRRSGLPLSTAKRLADQLVAVGALERDDASRYVIGLRLYEIASLAPRGHGLREIAGPYIEDLFVVTREHVQLAVLEGSHAVLVERRSRPGAVEVEYRIGGELPVLNTALGLALLAYLPAHELAEVLAACTHPDDQLAARNPEAVSRALATVRQNGVAVINRRTPFPIVAVAAPIRGRQETVVAALSVVVPSGGDPRSYEPVVRTAARGISRAVRTSQL